MKILITGSNGLVGTALVKRLQENGHEVNQLVRNKTKNPNQFYWNISKKEVDEKALDGIESIIHLAGASIGNRWTKLYKKEIIESRVDAANFLHQKCIENGILLKSFVSASGINYYGTYTSNNFLTEEDGILHHDFLSEVCEKWENSANNFKDITEKIVILRTAPVLSKSGGSFEQLKKISDFNLASGIGSGKQWFNWIHLHDLVEIYVTAIENPEMKGVYNAVAEEIPNHQIFMKRLAKANQKIFVPINIPKFLMKMILGEMSEMILEGTRVSNKKLKSLGFQFQYPDLDSAFRVLLGK